MYTDIKNYCNNGSENGLFLLDMPTGFGKTYSAWNLVFDNFVLHKDIQSFLCVLTKHPRKNDRQLNRDNVYVTFYLSESKPYEQIIKFHFP